MKLDLLNLMNQQKAAHPAQEGVKYPLVPILLEQTSFFDHHLQSGQWVDIIDHNIDHLQNLPQITVLTKLLDY